MKPIHLNLASRPYRDMRPLIVVVVALSLINAFLLVTNVDTYLRYKHETRSTTAQIADIERQTATERQRANEVTARVRGIDLVTLDRQSRFINAQLAERAFSWSELLDRLESVLAPDVRILSIAPSFQPNGVVKLSLQMESKSGEGMITMLNHFAADRQFANAFPSNETANEGMYAFGITVDYTPSALKVVR